MPRRFRHDFKHPLDKSERHVLMKQVTHGIDENRPRFFPCKGLFKRMFMKSQLESVSIIILAHGFQAFGHAFGVAEFAAGTDLGATRERVPSRLGPFNG